MFVDIHILQNFAPSNLNRDENGSPKSCKFGDFPRARASSQSWKRAARELVEDKKLLDPKTLGVRSLLLKDELKNSLMKGKEDEAKLEGLLFEAEKIEPQADYIAKFAFSAAQWQGKDDEESGYLQFLGKQAIEEITKLCLDDWNVFAETFNLLPTKQQITEDIKKHKADIKKLKTQAAKNPQTQSLLAEAESKQKIVEEKLKQVDEQIKNAEKNQGELAKKIIAALAKKHTPDIAMFGRMITTAPIHSIDAASQVAHAISTHAVWQGEFDYFTAVDELKKKHNPETDAGAAMIGITEFNSACYYRFASVDVTLLRDNLEHADDKEMLTRKTVEAFLTSFALAAPSGMKTRFAQASQPSLILAVVRDHYLCSLANAFVTPIRVKDEDEIGLVEKSINKLTKHFFTNERMYGKTIGTQLAVFCADSPEFIFKPQENETKTFVPKNVEVDSLEDLIQEITSQIFPPNQFEGESEQ